MGALAFEHVVVVAEEHIWVVVNAVIVFGVVVDGVVVNAEVDT